MRRHEIVWKVLTLPCSEAARLASEAIDHPQPASDRLALRLHTLICPSCRRYRRQLLTLRQVSSSLAGRIDPPGSPLPDDVRERIKSSLRDV